MVWNVILAAHFDESSLPTGNESTQSAVAHKLHDARAANLLRPMIAHFSGKDGKQLGGLVRAFRRHIIFDAAGQPCVVEASHTDAESQLRYFLADDAESLKDADAASAWVELHWDEIRSIHKRESKSEEAGSDKS